MSDQTLLDAEGREFTGDRGGGNDEGAGQREFLTPINPGNSVNGVLVFDVPEGLAPLHESMFSSGVLVSLAS